MRTKASCDVYIEYVPCSVFNNLACTVMQYMLLIRKDYTTQGCSEPLGLRWCVPEHTAQTLPGRVTGVVIGCASTGPNLSTLLNLGCRVPEQAGSNIRRSATAFTEAGGTHAHSLTLLFGVPAAVAAGASYVKGLQDKLVFL